MKINNALFTIAILLSINTFSQVSFEKGYYINNAGKKVNCLIKNLDWKNNPTDFEYKLTENSEPVTTTITNIKEFSILGKSKYIRHHVKIDKSRESINYLSIEKGPIFVEETLFLAVLIEGKASLFYYEKSNLKRYFYESDNHKLEQLVFKSYLTYPNYEKYDKSEVAENNQYKQQLWSNLKCKAISLSQIERLKYKKRDLVNFFTKYNNCDKSNFTNFEKSKKLNRKKLLSISVRPGLNNLSCELDNNVTSLFDLDTEFDNQSNFRLGIEAEIIMPFNKNKWAIIIEPTYQYFKTDQEITYLISPIENKKSTVNIDYSSIEIPIGVRHYMFLNKSSKLFVNAALVFDAPISTKISAKREEGGELINLDIVSNMNLAFGIGYKFMNKFSLELRLGNSRELLNDDPSWHSDYKSTSFIFGYTLF
ncbi:hypothetical protein GCM10023311_16600 [Flaviramulus aquimarinus]|uniref:Outer membrane protein beta-barrel domain-containing protein n=1 Tax=Flaviramulus aquimarinus TaxID=1170456 RepID=A0ABP9F4Q2_9FLAO